MAGSVTGTDVIRSALQARMRKINISGIARELGISVSELESFAAGTLKRDVVVMNALAPELFQGNAQINPATDLLEPAVKDPPRPLGIRPEPVLPSKKVWPVGQPPPGPQPVKPSPPVKKTARPGWAE